MSDRLIHTIDLVAEDPVVKAIINSENERQHACKDWLIQQTEDYVSIKDNFTVCIAGGWFGLLAHKLRQKYNDRITKLISFDRDKTCITVGKMLYPDSKIKFKWDTVQNFDPSKFDVIISTSCEHFSDKELNNFLSKRKTNTIVVLQNNNYFALPEHKNCKNNLNEFADSLDLHVIDSMELKTEAYSRYMVIAR